MKIAYFDCSSGISGDMTLGALVDAGASLREIEKLLGKLPVDGYELLEYEVKRNGLRGKKVDVVIDERVKRVHSGFTYIKEMIEGSGLPEEVKRVSVDVFSIIGRAEAFVHGTSIEKVHFHEVGAVDSIVDVVGSAIALTILGVERVYSSPLNVGSGTVSCAHGVLPVPAPATSEILKNTPIYSSGVNGELTTPTGAALMKSLSCSFGHMPEIKLEYTGCGAGSADIEAHSNCLRVFLGESPGGSLQEDEVSIIETNIDDMNPQLYEPLMDQLFDRGALDVFLTPIIMKKSRPAVKISVISERGTDGELRELLLRCTSTFGVRAYLASRTLLDREIVEVETSVGKVRYKKGFLNGSLLRALPEYEDAKRVAIKAGIPLKEVYDRLVAEGPVTRPHT